MKVFLRKILGETEFFLFNKREEKLLICWSARWWWPRSGCWKCFRSTICLIHKMQWLNIVDTILVENIGEKFKIIVGEWRVWTAGVNVCNITVTFVSVTTTVNQCQSHLFVVVKKMCVEKCSTRHQRSPHCLIVFPYCGGCVLMEPFVCSGLFTNRIKNYKFVERIV